jgi:tetratricopeptide (TPR) repeat protein
MNKHGSLALKLFILVIGINHLDAQDSIKTRMKSEAQQYFLQKEYARALPLYQELLKSFPKEPEYEYGAGVCLFQLNSEPEEAIRLLRPMPVAEYNPLALYYLGRSLHNYYSFEEAITAYSKFMLNGKAADAKQLNVERLIEMARNGIELTRTGRNIEVQSTLPVQLMQLPVVAEINPTGKLMKKPIEFCTKTDLKTGYRSWMYLPLYTEINEYVYVAGYDQGEKNGKQLFRVKNINHELWSPPEMIDEVINTPYDEEYPYFDTKTSTLYFSSTGHSSMGGFDIFRSIYNWNTKTWSIPENMGFPINSPYDDYVFITDGFGRSASFISNRKTGPSQAIIYRIKLEQDSTGVHFESVDDIRKASQLVLGNNVQASVEAAETTALLIQDSPMQEPAGIQDAEAQVTKTDYNRVLADALLLQIKADSLSRISRDMRIQAKESTEEEVKKQLIADILSTEKAGKNLQREADQKFAEARKIKEQHGDQPLNADSLVTADREMNGITVYRYKSGQEEDIQVEDIPVQEIAPPAPVKAEPKIPVKTDDFILLEKSPYHSANPIPQGLGSHAGLVYRIQLGVFSKEKPWDAFGGISPIAFERTPSGTMLKYFAGLFYTLNNVNLALEKVRTNGFPDAFIVAFQDGQPISTEKAREIEFSGYKMSGN